jgi:hypothetical protein
MSPVQPDPALPERLRAFHQKLPLEGDPPNALLSVSDDWLLYLVAILRDSPLPAPPLSLSEWKEFCDLLVPHRVFPLLAYRLRAWPPECRPPGKVMDVLDRTLLFSAALSVRAGREIQAVVDALGAAGIPSVLLKGPALARTVYPDPALRQSNDIDLLVRPADRIGAEEVLERLGYQGRRRVPQGELYAYHRRFSAPGNGHTVELHWSLDCEYHLVPDGWADRAIGRRTRLGSDDIACDTLDWSDRLLHLAFHTAFQHKMVRLDRILDFSRLIADQPDPHPWRQVVQQSVGYRLRISLELAITAAVLWTGEELQDGAGDSSGWPAPDPREPWLWDHSPARDSSALTYAHLILRGQQGPTEKLRWGCRFVLPPTPMMSEYRRSDSPIDIPIAHLRRWAGLARHRETR